MTDNYDFVQIIAPNLSPKSISAQVAQQIIAAGTFDVPNEKGYVAIVNDALYNALCVEQGMQVTVMTFKLHGEVVDVEILRSGDVFHRRV